MSAKFGDQLLTIRIPLWKYAFRLTRDPDHAEDLLSDTILRALVNHHQFEPGTNLLGWCNFIMRNLFLTGMRRRKWDGGSIEDLEVHQLPAIPAPQEAAVYLAEAKQAVQRMPEKVRKAVLMTGAGESYEYVAEQTGMALGTVKSQVFRARQRLIRMSA